MKKNLFSQKQITWLSSHCNPANLRVLLHGQESPSDILEAISWEKQHPLDPTQETAATEHSK